MLFISITIDRRENTDPTIEPDLIKIIFVTTSLSACPSVCPSLSLYPFTIRNTINPSLETFAKKIKLRCSLVGEGGWMGGGERVVLIEATYNGNVIAIIAPAMRFPVYFNN